MAHKRKQDTINITKRFVSIFLISILILGGYASFPSFIEQDPVQNAQGSSINVFYDDMEPGGPAASGEWTAIDVIGMFPPQFSASLWELGTPVPPPSAYSPSTCWGIELSGAYSSPTEVLLKTPPIDLTSGAIKNAELSFWHFYNNSQNDGGWVEVNPSPPMTGDLIEPDGGYPGMVFSFTTDNPGYNGSISAWEKATFDLSAYIGQTITLGFRFCGYNANAVYRGWYIDDVSVNVTWNEGPAIEPDQKKVGLAGDTLQYTLTVTNFNLDSDFIDIYFTDFMDWPVIILNATTGLPLEDSGGQPGTPDVFLGSEESVDILVNVTIPSDVTDWDVADTTIVYATSFNNSMSDTAELVTKTPFPDVGIKSLYIPKLNSVGNTVVMDVEVENLGDWPFSFDVEGIVSAMLINPPSTNEPSIQTVTGLLPGDSTHLQWTFVPTVAITHTFTATTLLYADQVEVNNRYSKDIAVKDFLWTDDMEAGGDAALGLWSTFETSGNSNPTQWEWGAPQSLVGPWTVPSPTNLWGTDLVSTYIENTDCYLFTPASSAFDLRGFSEIKLGFTNWYEIQDSPAGDYGYIVYTYDSDPIGIPGVQGPVTQYIGRSSDWEYEELDMGFLSGQPYVRFGWRLYENIGGNNFQPNTWAGWYLDDVYVWAIRARPELIITEIVDSGGNEYIEVYNRGTLSASLSDYGLTLDKGVTWLSLGTWSTGTITPGGHAYYNIPSTYNLLNDQGDTISLVNRSVAAGLITDEVSYGQEGTVPDPLPGESASRYWNMSKYDDTWARDPTPTIGSLNDGPGEVAPKYVVLNEVFFNPQNPTDAFVELIYVGDENDPAVDVNGWLLVMGDSVFSIPPGTYSTILNHSNPFYVISVSMVPGLFGTVNIDGDNIYLYTSSGLFVDEVGWSTSHEINTSMSRFPDGFGVALWGKPFGLMGYDNTSSIAAGWVFSRPPTIPYILVYPDQTLWSFPGDYVRFNLTIKNRQGAGGLVEINKTDTAGWLIEIMDALGTTPLSDSDSDGTPDVWVGGNSQINVTVSVFVSEDFPIPDVDLVTIHAQWNADIFTGDFAFLTINVYPHLETAKSIAPSTIYVEGTGYGEQAKITLEVRGAGQVVPGERSDNADIVFVIDDTGSMADAIDDLKQAVNNLVDRLAENISSLRLGLVSFKDDPYIDVDLDLTFDTNAFKTAVNALVAEGGSDNQEDQDKALELAANLSWRMDDNVTRIMILITDWDCHDNVHLTQVAKWAYEQKGIYTNCIGIQHWFALPPDPPGYYVYPQAEYWLKRTAENGSGYYKEYGLMDELVDIILNGIMMIMPPMDLAGEDTDITDSNPMIRDVLPPYISYIPGSFSIPPDTIYVDGVGKTVLEWNVTRLRIAEVWRVTFRVTSSTLGLVDSNDYLMSKINYTRWDNSSKTTLFPKTQVNVIVPPPLPPELFIEVVDETHTTNGRGDNIRLYWEPSPSPRISYYLIYRSGNQTGFDFSSPWRRTDVHTDFGVIPLRTTWNDTDACDPLSTNYKKEWYYTVRAVNEDGAISTTSRTVGKWTRIFDGGISTFSLPLEPLVILQTDNYTTDMNAEYIRYMDETTRTWRKHNQGDLGINNTLMICGEGFEVKFPGANNKYTFCGLPGAMIMFDDDSGFTGFEASMEAGSLYVMVNPGGEVNLYWSQPSSMGPGGWYEVYYSNSRDGFFGTKGIDYFQIGPKINFSTNWAVHSGAQAQNPGTRLYYMVVPFNSGGVQGSSTYSKGIWTQEFLSQYDTMALPLKIDYVEVADWFCNNIPDTVGINYFIYEEQRWGWHSTNMPEGAYDPDIVMAEGYQISTLQGTKYIFIGT